MEADTCYYCGKEILPNQWQCNWRDENGVLQTAHDSCEVAHEVEKMSEPKETKEMRKRRRAQTLANLLSHFNIMVRYCSWCSRIIGFSRGGTGITDGMCNRCYKELTEAENGKAHPKTLHHQDTG